MTEEVEVETRQIYLIPTEGPDGMQNTEVIDSRSRNCLLYMILSRL